MNNGNNMNVSKNIIRNDYIRMSAVYSYQLNRDVVQESGKTHYINGRASLEFVFNGESEGGYFKMDILGKNVFADNLEKAARKIFTSRTSNAMEVLPPIHLIGYRDSEIMVDSSVYDGNFSYRIFPFGTSRGGWILDHSTMKALIATLKGIELNIYGMNMLLMKEMFTLNTNTPPQDRFAPRGV